jgi:hypothetical protein
MDTRLTPSRLFAIMLTSTLALPASAGDAGETTGVATAPGMPYYELAESDAVARANAQVDLAEHALALMRQGFWSPRDGLHLLAARMTQGDKLRVAFYKEGVQVARRQLMDLLRERQAPMQLAALLQPTQ